MIVTGAAAGIGRATALRFAREGARVAGFDVDAAKGPGLVEEIRAAGGEGAFEAVNVAEPAPVEAGVKAVLDRWGKVDVLVNNAGILRDAQLVKWKDGAVAATLSDDAWDAVIGVNLKGVFHCTRAVVPHMIEAGGGVILNASSVVGLYGNFGQTNYVASKAGVDRHDAHLGARARPLQDPRERRGSGLRRDRDPEGDAPEDPRHDGRAHAARPHRHHRGHRQRVLLARLGPGELRHRRAACRSTAAWSSGT